VVVDKLSRRGVAGADSSFLTVSILKARLAAGPERAELVPSVPFHNKPRKKEKSKMASGNRMFSRKHFEEGEYKGKSKTRRFRLRGPKQTISGTHREGKGEGSTWEDLKAPHELRTKRNYIEEYHSQVLIAGT